MAVLIGLMLTGPTARSAELSIGRLDRNPEPLETFAAEIQIDVADRSLAGYHVELVYDAGVVAVVSVSGGVTPGFDVAPTTDPVTFTSGMTPVAAVRADSAQTGVVSVAVVSWRAIGDRGEGSELDVVVRSLVDVEATPIPVSVVPSSVLIGFDPLDDSDGDGLTNEEEFEAGTSFDDADSDADGLPDGFEVSGGLDPLDDGSGDASQLPTADPDGDGLDNAAELAGGCSPSSADGDDDGLSDVVESVGPTDCSVADTDGDGLLDGFEVSGNLDALDDGTTDPDEGPTGDPDGDTLNNLAEQLAGTRPDLADTDGDGLPDDFELSFQLDPLDDGSQNPLHGAAGDPDVDGLDNAGEFVAGTNPRLPDSDGDSLTDAFELSAGLDPLDDGSIDPSNGIDGDADGDGVTNLEELIAGTAPNDFRSRPMTLSLTLDSGLALLAHFFDVEGPFTALELLGLYDGAGTSGAIRDLRGFDTDPDLLLLAMSDEISAPTFALSPGEGVAARIDAPTTIEVSGVVACPTFDLTAGPNLVGLVCLPNGLSAFGLLAAIGDETEVSAIQRFDSTAGRFETAVYDGGDPAGVDFALQMGEALIVHMLVPVTGFDPLN